MPNIKDIHNTCCIYNADGRTKIVNVDEAEMYYKDGWLDRPFTAAEIQKQVDALKQKLANAAEEKTTTGAKNATHGKK